MAIASDSRNVQITLRKNTGYARLCELSEVMGRSKSQVVAYALDDLYRKMIGRLPAPSHEGGGGGERK